MKYTEAQIEDVLEEVRMKYTQEQIDEYRRIWLEQLRSPEAKQAKGKLEDVSAPDHRCCLGHACHILGLPRVVKRETEWAAKELVFYGKDYGESSWLPLEARQKLNISLKGSFKTDVKVGGISVNALSVINDYTKLSLSEIADVIEEQFKNNNFMQSPLMD